MKNPIFCILDTSAVATLSDNATKVQTKQQMEPMYSVVIPSNQTIIAASTVQINMSAFNNKAIIG